jgi:hypothetical protein
VTRRALAADLVASPYWWAGDLDELSLLERLQYDLDALPDTDGRYKSAREDIIQHCVNNPMDWEVGWIFTDDRFQLPTDDSRLLAFLAETLHPEVRSDEQSVVDLAELYNRHLRRDGVELFARSEISGRPVYGWRSHVAKSASLLDLRIAVKQSILDHLNGDQVAAFCNRVGLGPQGPEENPPRDSKGKYVDRHTDDLELAQLIPIARRIANDFRDDELLKVVDAAELAQGGVVGAAKNLVFAATNKPEVVFTDFVNSDAEIARDSDEFLVYRRPIGSAGLSWQDLVSWWMDDHPGLDQKAAANALYSRLSACLGAADNPERPFLRVYTNLYKSEGFHLPALLPQVWLHLDPRGPSDGTLKRQRMDFMLFLPNRRRVLLELDGKHHYSEDGKPSPRLYAEMVREDRRIRLEGYEVYRFGGAEMLAVADPEQMLLTFFRDLLRKHGIKVSDPPA